MPEKYKHTFSERNTLRGYLKWVLACNNER